MSELDFIGYNIDIPKELVDIIKEYVVKITHKRELLLKYEDEAKRHICEFVVKNINIDISEYLKSKYETYDICLRRIATADDDDHSLYINDNANDVLSYVTNEYLKNIPEDVFKYDIKNPLNEYLKYVVRIDKKEYNTMNRILYIIGRQYKLSRYDITKISFEFLYQ